MRIIYLFIFSIMILNAKQLNCVHYAHFNHSTGTKHFYNKQEQSNMPPFVMNVSTNVIYVDLPSGNKEQFNLKDIKSGEKQYFSKNNYYLRQPPQNPDVWYWDMRLNGQLQSVMLICK